MSATPSDAGYWLVASDGGVFTYGDARLFGSAGGIGLNEPMVDLAAAPSRSGYWFVARDGGVFAHGPGAGFRGSAAADPLTKPMTAIAARPSGAGYWMAAVGVRISRPPSFTVLFPPRGETNGDGGPCTYFNPDRFRIRGSQPRYDLAISMTVLEGATFGRGVDGHQRSGGAISEGGQARQAPRPQRSTDAAQPRPGRCRNAR